VLHAQIGIPEFTRKVAGFRRDGTVLIFAKQFFRGEHR
jgi:hypothetical protein